MNKKRMAAKLDDYAGAGVPADVDLWPALAARLDPARPPRRATPGTIPAQAPRVKSAFGGHAVLRPALNAGLAGGVMALLVAVVLLAGTVAGLPGESSPHGQAASPTVSLTGAEPTSTPPSYAEHLAHFGLNHVGRLGTWLHQRQTLGDYTVLLDGVYADANQAIVIYTVEGAGSMEGQVVPTASRLEGPDGVRLAPLFGHRCPLQANMYILAFDTAALPALPDRLDLALSLEVVATTGAGDPSLFADAAVDSAPWAAGAAPGTHVAGPFQIAFAVPVTRAGMRVGTPNQTVYAQGGAMTLERVVVTASEVRALLRYTPPDRGGVPWQPLVTLRTSGFDSGAEINQQVPLMVRPMGPDRWSYHLFTALADQPGEWTLSVLGVIPGPDGLSEPTTDRQSGPWIFKFTLPDPSQ